MAEAPRRQGEPLEPLEDLLERYEAQRAELLRTSPRQEQQQQQQQQQQQDSGADAELLEMRRRQLQAVEQRVICAMNVVERNSVAWSSDPLSTDCHLHKVTPADTLVGLELRYGVSSSVIMRLNGMMSDRLTSHLVLKIPRTGSNPTHLKPTVYIDKKTEQMQIERLFRVRWPDISTHEIEVYVRQSGGSVRQALAQCQRDMEWETANKNLLPLKSKYVPVQSKPKRGVKGWLSWLGWKRPAGVTAPVAITAPAEPVRSSKSEKMLEAAALCSPAEIDVAVPGFEADYEQARSPLLSEDFLERARRVP